MKRVEKKAMKFYILEDKKPKLVPDETEWQNWMAHSEYKCIVNETILNGDVFVLTVFKGCCTDEEPMLFVTVILGGLHNTCQRKTQNWEAAARQHVAAIKLVMAELN